MDQPNSNHWRKCSVCKKPIGFGARYYVCSVSTCNGQRTGYTFCSVVCFDSHVPGARHKDAAAIENRAPAQGGAVRIVKSAEAASPAATKEVLIVASRLKDYIQARAGMNTSAQVMDALSDFVRIACDHAIDNARADGRKTVLDRDFQFLKGK